MLPARASWLSGATVAIGCAAVACGDGAAGRSAVAVDPLGLGAATAAVEVAALYATSGASPAALFDGDTATGWRPSGDPAEEGVTVRFSAPLLVDDVRVVPCDETSRLRVRLWLDGTEGPVVTVGAGRDTRVELPDEARRHGVARLGLRFEAAQGDACLAEVALGHDTRGLRLTPPRTTAATAAASATRAPDALHGVALAFDGRIETRWQAPDAAAGASLAVTFPAPIAVHAVEIHNGDHASVAAYAAAARATAWRVDAGGVTARFDVEDRLGPQKLALPEPAVTDRLVLTAERVAVGTGPDGVGVAEVRVWDADGPVRPDVAAPPPPAAVERHVGVTYHSVCGYPRRTLRLWRDGEWARREPGDAAALVTLEGRWAEGAADGPWTGLSLLGRRLPAGARWGFEPDANAAVGFVGDLGVARVADLGPDGFRALLDAWGGGAARDRVTCLTEELGAWPEPWQALADGEAIAVRGVFTDLLWRQPLDRASRDR